MAYGDWFKEIQNREEEKKKEELNFGMKVEIDELVYQKVMHWVNKSKYEVSGLGKVILDEETNVIRVVDAMLLPQENTTSHTDIDAKAVGKAMFQLKDSPGDLRWWWHSHVGMDVFWSGTDVATLKELGSGGWFTATVFNQKNEMKSAFVQSAPVRLIAEDVSCKVTSECDPWAKHREEWNESYEENVTNKTYSSFTLGDKEGVTNSYLQQELAEFNREPRYHNAHGEVEEVGVDAEKEEEVEELTLDEIFEQHSRGEITDSELYTMMNDLYEGDEGEGEAEEGEEDNYNVLSDAEADAMDLRNHGRTFNKED